MVLPANVEIKFCMFPSWQSIDAGASTWLSISPQAYLLNYGLFSYFQTRTCEDSKREVKLWVTEGQYKIYTATKSGQRERRR